MFPNHEHLFVFDNSSNHGLFSEDALVANRANKGWGGKQPRMRSTHWRDEDGEIRVQHMIFQPGDPEPISKYGGRLQHKECPPSHIGQPKGTHQILHERNLLGDVTAWKKVQRPKMSQRMTEIYEWLETNGTLPMLIPTLITV